MATKESTQQTHAETRSYQRHDLILTRDICNLIFKDIAKYIGHCGKGCGNIYPNLSAVRLFKFGFDKFIWRVKMEEKWVPILVNESKKVILTVLPKQCLNEHLQYVDTHFDIFSTLS